MSKLDGSLENKTINFGPEDLVINKWSALIRQSKKCKLTEAARTAIRYYINHGDFCCVGKIFLSNDDHINYAVNNHICIYVGSSPDIQKWISEMSSFGQQVNPIIREILINSIVQIDHPDKEWIPNKIDIIRMECNTISTNPPKVVEIPSTSAEPVLVLDKQIEKSNIETKTGLKSGPLKSDVYPKENGAGAKAKPKAFALSGKRLM